MYRLFLLAIALAGCGNLVDPGSASVTDTVTETPPGTDNWVTPPPSGGGDADADADSDSDADADSDADSDSDSDTDSDADSDADSDSDTDTSSCTIDTDGDGLTSANCGGPDCDDDNDGYDNEAGGCGGDDCNDGWAPAYPGATNWCVVGDDLNCNGIDDSTESECTGGGDADTDTDSDSDTDSDTDADSDADTDSDTDTDTVELCLEFDSGVTEATIYYANITTGYWTDWFANTPLFDGNVTSGVSYCEVVPDASLDDDIQVNGYTTGGNGYLVYGDTSSETDGTVTMNGIDCHVQVHSPADGGGDYLCDGYDVADDDSDNDGHDSIESGGDDCDDNDPYKYPGAVEVWDIRDNDCDGSQDESGRLLLHRWFYDHPDRVYDVDGNGFDETYDDLEHRYATSTPGATWTEDDEEFYLYPLDLCTDSTYKPHDGCVEQSDGTVDLWGGAYALVALDQCVGTEIGSALHLGLLLQEDSVEFSDYDSRSNYTCTRLGFVPVLNSVTCDDLNEDCVTLYRHAGAPFYGVPVTSINAGDVMYSDWSVEGTSDGYTDHEAVLAVLDAGH